MGVVANYMRTKFFKHPLRESLYTILNQIHNTELQIFQRTKTFVC